MSFYGPPGGDGGGRGRGRGPPRERRMTPKGQMSGNNSAPPIQMLPPHLKAMFEPRPPIVMVKPSVRKNTSALSGLAAFKDLFETEPAPPRDASETPAQKRTRLRDARMAAHQEAIELLAEDWDPNKNTKSTEDPYKTLFVARISYDTTEKKLERDFSQFGPIKSVRMVTDNEGKPRGYAFIEYEREADMKEAYKRADGRKIDGRRVVVDVERGRTVKGWRPRRLGGGLGGTRKGSDAVNVKFSGRDDGGDRARESSRGPPDDASRSSYDSRDRNRDRDRDRDRRPRSRDRDRDRDRDRRDDGRYGHYGGGGGGGGGSRRDDRDKRRRSSSRSPGRDRKHQRY